MASNAPTCKTIETRRSYIYKKEPMQAKIKKSFHFGEETASKPKKLKSIHYKNYI